MRRNNHRISQTVDRIRETGKPIDAWRVMKKRARLHKPLVIVPGSSGLVRRGTGWSIPEIEESRPTRKEIRKLGMRIDQFRKSKHEINVEALNELTDLFLKKNNHTSSNRKKVKTVQG